MLCIILCSPGHGSIIIMIIIANYKYHSMKATEDVDKNLDFIERVVRSLFDINMKVLIIRVDIYIFNISSTSQASGLSSGSIFNMFSIRVIYLHSEIFSLILRFPPSSNATQQGTSLLLSIRF